MKFQQKQRQEREQKQVDSSGGRNLVTIDTNDANNKIKIRNGKVHIFFFYIKKFIFNIKKFKGNYCTYMFFKGATNV